MSRLPGARWVAVVVFVIQLLVAGTCGVVVMDEVAGVHPEGGVLAHAAVVAALVLLLLVVVVLVVGVDGAEVLRLLEAQQPALAPVTLAVTVAPVHVLHSGGATLTYRQYPGLFDRGQCQDRGVK